MSAETTLRDALAAVEVERDDALTYLGTIRAILETLGRMQGLRACAHELARVLVQELGVESCAIVLRGDAGGRGRVVGFATQAQRFGEPADRLGVSGWIELAARVRPDLPQAWFRPAPEGSLVATAPGETDGERFHVVPFSLGDERLGAVVLHALVEPAQRFARAMAIPIIADAVGQALTIARSRDETTRLAEQLERELGMTRQALSARDLTLRARESTVASLTEEVVRLNRVKREFLATVSHELRTPLNAIVGFGSLLREEVAGPINPEQGEMLDGLLRGAGGLTALIDDILLFVQLDADRLAPSNEEVDLRDLVEEAVAAVDGRDAARTALRIDIDPRAERLSADPMLLRRIVFHLVGNAFKFTNAGEVGVKAFAADAPGGVVLEVHDTGMGMPPDRVTEMLRVFTQGDGSTRRRHPGLGLGLGLVHRAVRALGGELAVESEPGRGTTFRALLPGARAGAGRRATNLGA